MRFILAAVAFVASVVLLIIGGVQFSQASNVSEVTAVGTVETAAPLTVIHHDTLASRAGTQSIELAGSGEIFVAVGRSEDVSAWVGETRHNVVTLAEDSLSDDGTTMLLESTEAGAEPTAPSPAGNDLWFEEHSGEGTLSLDVVVSPGYSLLIASDGTAPAPSQIEISWPFGGYAPMVGPLLTAGLILLLAALALLVWALLYRRRTRESIPAGNGDARPEVAVDATSAEREPAEDWSPVAWDDAATGDAHAEPERVPAAHQKPSPTTEIDSGAATSNETSPFAAPSPETEAATQPEAATETVPMAEPAVEPPADEAAELAPAAEPVGEPAAEPEIKPESGSGTEIETEPGAVIEPKPESGQAIDTDSGNEPAPASGQDTKWRRPRGRNRSSAPKRQFFVAPVLIVTALTLAGCAPQYWPAEWTNADIVPTGTPTSTVEAALIEEGAMPPTLNEAQLGEVIADAAALATEADAALDPTILEPRFTSDALQHRASLYEAKKLDGELPGPLPFPDGEIVYAVPEATEAWPRVVFAVVNPSEDAAEGALPAGAMLVQEDARANFKVASLTELAAGATLPEAAPASVGAPSVANLEDPLVMAPEDVAAAYADVIAKGDASEYAATFDATNDTLRAQVNDAYRESLSTELDPEVISIGFAYAATKTAPIGITSIDGGAILAVSITEIETLEAANDRAIITVSGRTAVLSGATTSETGFVRTYTDQLLFYVPSQETGGPIQFLGVAQAMTDAKVLEES